MGERVPDVVRDVGHAPCPAADLGVLLDERAGIRPGSHRVAVDRDEQGDRLELARVAEERLPVETAVLWDCVRRPVVDLVDGL